MSCRNVLIILLLCTATSTARSQGVGVPTPIAPFVEESAPLAAAGLYSADAAEANAAVLAAGRWRAPLRDDGALAAFARRLGDLRVVGPALLAGYVTGRVRGVPDLSAASARVAGATVGAALMWDALQSVTNGRARAGAELIPSSRTTIAFAAAAAVDAESRPGWVRWIAYPAAAGVAVADARGGPGAGTALAGAALGLAAGHALDRIEHDRVPLFERARFLARGSRRDFRVGFQASF